MTINKFVGKTEEEAKAKAREELGSAAVIMNIKEIKPKGLSGIFKSSTYEVTAAIEDEPQFSKDAQNFANPVKAAKPTSTFEAVADDDAELLKNAFSAVNEVLERQGNDVDTMPNVAKESKELDIAKEIQKESAKIDAKSETAPSFDSFEPLSDTAPRAHLLEPTYSRPTMAAAKVSSPRNTFEAAHESAPVTETAAKRTTEIKSDDIPGLRPSIDNENHVFVKMLYNVLLDNEVQEKYINQVLEDMDKVLQTSHSLDNLLSSVYQKMVLKLGTPNVISATARRPKVVFFIGPTGVGKTTTIAKIASKFKVEEGKKVALITADTFRMAAANQLQTYANILGVPLNVIYSSDELLDTVKKQSRENEELDVILVDTIGFSHKNEEQRNDTKKLISSLDGYYDSEVYLTLSATTKYKDLLDIVDSYMSFTDFNLIFTKLDETKSLGNLFNLKIYTDAPLSYITYGQNVPDDIEVVNAQKLVKQLLGGN